MDKRKIIVSFELSLIAAVVTVAIVFYAIDALRIARGLKPVLLKAPQDITTIIPPIGEKKQETSATGTEAAMPLRMPQGFSISIFAKDLGAPRVMMWGPDSNVWTSIPSQGKVVALRDTNGDGAADVTAVMVSGLNRPHGLASKCDNAQNCTIYIAEADQVATYDYDRAHSVLVNKKKIIDLPDGGRHLTRTIMFMPSPSQVLPDKIWEGKPDENKLLISVGSSCDVCNEADTRRAKILAFDVITGELKEFAKGLRNSVFMATHPVTGKIWATEMGRDMLGDDLPPDEINIIEEGKNYGWPTCYGKNVHDTAFDANTYIRNPCMEPFETPSAIDIPAHSAPLGLAFFPEEGWPQEYWHNLLVAYHGSWNRSEPAGYTIARYKLDAQGNYFGVEDFISGWLENGRALGRPVDILIQPGGTIFVSDDKAGVIYRITRQTTQEDISAYIRSKDDLIRVPTIGPDMVVASPLTITGEARGNWFFEASFPVRLLDATGKEIAIGIARAEGDWMTEKFVPFTVTLRFQEPITGSGTLVLEKDNPSGLPEHADSLRIPVRFGE